MDKVYLTVTALTKYIKYKFDVDCHLSNVLLKGEISNFKRHSRGHFYFTIKDEGAQITAVMFASSAMNVSFEPVEGQMVLVEGRVLVYEPSGNYQINVTKMEPDGIGALYLAYEKLKKELSQKGLFDQKHKKPIPKFPKVIGVITSKTGAAVRDIIQTIGRRYPLTKVYLYPCLVQGESSKSDIVKQIEQANKDGYADVLILGRGGGSIEDLWAFNEEVVAYAIYNSKIPIISAVGHEVDFTIADFVADLRAATPTAAAELATPSKEDLIKYLLNIRLHLDKDYQAFIENFKMVLLNYDRVLENCNPISILKRYQERLSELETRLGKGLGNYLSLKDKEISELNHQLILNSPINQINVYKEEIKRLQIMMDSDFKAFYQKSNEEFLVLVKKLEVLSPLNVMKKGYSIVEINQKVISRVEDVKKDDVLDIHLSNGIIEALVMGGKEDE